MFFSTLVDQGNQKLPLVYDYRYLYEFSNLPNRTKIQAALIYLKRILKALEEGQRQDYLQQTIQFERKLFEKIITDMEAQITQNQSPMSAFQLEPSKMIEDHHQCIRIDFANKFIGGGILTAHSAQEEILMSCSPESQIAILLCESMLPSESISIKGTERVALHKGYKNTFQITEEYKESNDNYMISAMDAIPYTNVNLHMQFEKKDIMRELKKAITGFSGDEALDTKAGRKIDVCTGNWGSGVFNADVQLKLIIQWLAASVLQRKVVYCSFGQELYDGKIEDVLKTVAKRSIAKNLKLILSYRSSGFEGDLFSYLLAQQ